MLYDTFDKIVCINLKERTDKHDSVVKIFRKLKIPVDFFFADKNPTSGRIGCFDSHVTVIKECYNNGGNSILIFEDDVIETSSYHETVMKDVLEFLMKNEWCEYFQLGYTILPHEFLDFFSCKTLTKNIVQYNGNTTHSYILNRAGMKRVIDTWESNIQTEDLDIYFKKIFSEKGACICPILFEQNFCIENDNEVATTFYYKMMRYISCLQYKFSFLYLLSALRISSIFISLFVISIFVIPIFILLLMLLFTKKVYKMKRRN